MPKQSFTKRYYQLPKAEIAYLRFTLESYDGLAFQRTLDSAAGLVEIIWPTERITDVEALLSALSEEIDWREVPPPEVIPPI
ncbi:MAG: DUF4911 domain-containing protein [Desulfuromonadales bacterium]|nr:DUF4911 domain-containing protein [Desulfuromonadales bacterium]